jgi:hypothetical protein
VSLFYKRIIYRLSVNSSGGRAHREVEPSASLSAAALAMFELEEGGSSFTRELAKNSSK